jgi:hypothetical protein
VSSKENEGEVENESDVVVENKEENGVVEKSKKKRWKVRMRA